MIQIPCECDNMDCDLSILLTNQVFEHERDHHGRIVSEDCKTEPHKDEFAAEYGNGYLIYRRVEAMAAPGFFGT